MAGDVFDFWGLMPLPLLERATPDGLTFALTRRSVTRSATATALRARHDERIPLAPIGAPLADGRMPERAPGPGEQYRFHFDMKKCIGCKCCVVACNEQNGNPAAINWRRVGEIEGGFFPNATRSYLSMGCNHCLEPTCMSGCPVDAYSKDPVTGIVRHSADACIGCQYCTWNCSYGVPQYNADRGVVGKCDMCHGRLELGQSPACVSACPEGAIAIEIVNIDEWRSAVDGAARDRRPADRRSQPVDDAHHDARRAAAEREAAGHHARQARAPALAAGGDDRADADVGRRVHDDLAAAAARSSSRLGVAALASLLVGALALNASTLHLGRPVHAYRALKMWRRSWLSREVLLFTSFSVVAGAYAGAAVVWRRWHPRRRYWRKR